MLILHLYRDWQYFSIIFKKTNSFFNLSHFPFLLVTNLSNHRTQCCRIPVKINAALLTLRQRWREDGARDSNSIESNDEFDSGFVVSENWYRIRYEGIADLIDAKLERGSRLKSRGDRGQVFSLEISPDPKGSSLGGGPLSISHRENVLARNIKCPPVD